MILDVPRIFALKLKGDENKSLIQGWKRVGRGGRGESVCKFTNLKKIER